MALLEIKGLNHQFHQTMALENINLTLESGEVQALVGENGAGKSTLIKLLSGVYRRQSGELLREGQPLELGSPQQSLAAGIQVIHQERQLIPAFTAAENMYLGLDYERRSVGIDRRRMEAKCQSLLAQWGIDLWVLRPASQL